MRYKIEGDRLRLEIDEGARVTVGEINFVGNEHIATRQALRVRDRPDARALRQDGRRQLPFVKDDLEEGVELVRRLYIAEGYLNADRAGA